MNQWIPVISVIVGLLLLNNVIPGYVTMLLILVLVVLVFNKWDIISQYFQ